MPNSPNKPSQGGALTTYDIAVFLIGGSIIVGLVAFLVEFYGRGGETSAGAVLGIVIPVVGTLASGALGLSVGTASGKSGGKEIVASKAKTAATLVKQVQTLQSKFIAPHKSRPEHRKLPGETDAAMNLRIESLGRVEVLQDHDYDTSVQSQISEVIGGLKALAAEATSGSEGS